MRRAFGAPHLELLAGCRLQLAGLGVAALLVCGHDAAAAPLRASDPQSPPADAVQVVYIDLAEWSLAPSPAVVQPGRVRFIATNHGTLAHALAVEGSDFYQETDGIGSGESVVLEVTFDAAGTYDLYCPVNAGQHRSLGQESSLQVGPMEDSALE